MDGQTHGEAMAPLEAPSRLWNRWVFAMTVGELVGFAVPAGVGAIGLTLRLPDPVMFGLLVLAGVGEGTVLGVGQWLALRRSISGLSRRDWVLATALAAGVAWLLGMLPANVGSRVAVHPLALAAGAIVLGAVFLLAIGGAQWLVLRRHLAGARRWIVANAVAWPVGVAVPVVALSLVPDGATAVLWAVVGITSGMLMGAVVGAITGLVLVRLVGAQGQRRLQVRLIAAN